MGRSWVLFSLDSLAEKLFTSRTRTNGMLVRSQLKQGEQTAERRRPPPPRKPVTHRALLSLSPPVHPEIPEERILEFYPLPPLPSTSPPPSPLVKASSASPQP